MSSRESGPIVQLLDAIGAEAARSADKPVALVSVTFDWIKPVPEGGLPSARASVTRATRTIIFSKGELRAGDDLLLSASAVHRVVET